MRQELIDLYLGELPEAEAEAWRVRLGVDADLEREYSEVASLFSFMARAEPVTPEPRSRERVLREIERLCRPTLLEWLRDIGGLVRFRFRTSRGFRIAAFSLAVHLIAMGILFKVYMPRRAQDSTTTVAFVKEGRPGVSSPAAGFVSRLMARRGPQAPRLRRFGVAGQPEAIRSGLETLLARQAGDGSFGTPRETAHAALALLAEGDCSTIGTRRGRAISKAIRNLLYREPDASAVEGETGENGAILAALVEDYGLSFDDLSTDERECYSTRIDALIRGVAARRSLTGFDREGLALAQLAGFQRAVDLAADKRLGRELVRARAPEGDPVRAAVTAVLARGHTVRDPARVKAWAAPLFDRSVADIHAGRVTGLVLLNLQAPYRL